MRSALSALLYLHKLQENAEKLAKCYTPEFITHCALMLYNALKRFPESVAEHVKVSKPKDQHKGGTCHEPTAGISKWAPLTLYSYIRKSSLWASSGRAPS